MHIFFRNPLQTERDDCSLKDSVIHGSAHLIESTGAAAPLVLPERPDDLLQKGKHIAKQRKSF